MGKLWTKIKGFFVLCGKAIASFFKKTFKYLKHHKVVASFICLAIVLLLFFNYIWIVTGSFPLFHRLTATQIAILLSGVLVFCSVMILATFVVFMLQKEKKMNEELMQQNKDIATICSKKAVLPYIALTNVSIKKNHAPQTLQRPNFVGGLEGLKESFEKNINVNEYMPNEFFFTIGNDKVSMTTSEPKEIEDFSKKIFANVSFEARQESKRLCTATAKNVGNGNACSLTCGLFKKGEHESDFLHKSSVALSLEKEKELKLTLFVKEQIEDGEYYLYFKYDDIYGDKYIQGYPLTIKDSKIASISLEYNQKTRK